MHFWYLIGIDFNCVVTSDTSNQTEAIVATGESVMIIYTTIIVSFLPPPNESQVKLSSIWIQFDNI